MTKTAEKPDKTLLIHSQRDETEEQAVARVMLDPALQAASTIQEYTNSPIDLDLAALIDCLEKQVGQVDDGNVKQIEQMLLSQAHALDAIANNLFRRAKVQDYMGNLDAYMKLGLRAQSQCRANLETLMSMRKPSHLNQTNIGYNQQVNNGIAPNELLEKADGERLDTGTAQEAIRGDQTLETVAAINRATKP